MSLTITHAKTDNIADWTQADLDAEIALGNFPPGTLLADIVLPSDWNAPLNVSGRLDLANLAQGTALSVLGVAGNATADYADITAGTDGQVLRRSGTSIGFGALNLNNLNATTGTLPQSRGGIGINTGYTDGSVIFQRPGFFGEDNARFFWDNTNKFLSLGTNSNYTSKLNILIGTNTHKGLVIRAASGQTANLQEWQDTSGNLIGGTWSDGSFLIPAFNNVSGERRFSFKAEGGAYSTSLVIDRNRNQTNYGNWCGLVLRDNAKEVTLRLMSNSFAQNDGDFEICHGGGSSAIVIVRVTGKGTLFYNPFVNTQNISVIRVPTQTLYLGGGSPSPQGTFDFEQCTIAATSGNSVADAAQLVLRGAPIVGTNMTITRAYAGLFYAGRPGGCPLGLRLDALQTANAFEIRDSGITTQFAIAANGRDFILDTTTGTKIGTATTQKLGFFNATPIVQPANTTDLRAAIINLGLLASGGATPLDLNAGALFGYSASTNAQTGTTYTLAASDTGKVVTLSNASAITLTLPNSLIAGFVCTVIQKGAGQVTFTAASGATLRNRQSHTKTAGQYAVTTLYVDSNSGGSAADYYLAGDTAA